ncbi:TnpV protein, partial [Anaerotruncus colihominis]
MSPKTFVKTYRQEGDYLLPNLAALESIPVGIWCQRRKQYLREHRNNSWGRKRIACAPLFACSKIILCCPVTLSNRPVTSTGLT